MFLGELLKPVGGKFLLHCNFEVSKLNISLPAFYRQCLVAWSELNAREPSSVHEIVKEVITNNKFLCVDNKYVYRRDIADQGFCKIWDLFSVDNVRLNPEQRLFIMSVINSMPAAWRLLIRKANIAPVLSPLPNTPAILINDILIPILDASSKHIYWSFLAKKQTTPTAKEKLRSLVVGACVQTPSDRCIYVVEGDDPFMIAVHVDDLILAGTTDPKIAQVKQSIAERFDVKDMGVLNYFSGMQVIQKSGKVWIGQPTYAEKMFSKFGMDNARPVDTPVDPTSKLCNFI